MGSFRPSSSKRIDTCDSYKIDFVDPVWKAIVKDYRGFKDSIFTEASSLNRDHMLSCACLDAAKKHGVMTDNDSFRFAFMGDDNDACLLRTL